MMPLRNIIMYRWQMAALVGLLLLASPLQAADSLPLAVVTPMTVPIHYVTSGTVTSDHRVAVGSRLSGYIRDLTVREGERVTHGQVLFRIDPVDVRQQLAQSKANLANARTDLRRYQTLLDNKAISRQQFDQVKLRFDVAASKVKQARNQLQYAVIKSPLDGVVVQKKRHNGDLASPGSAVLMVENTLKMTVDTRVSEQFVPRIHIGDHPLLRITGFPHPLRATVRQVVAVADSRSHQFLIKLTLPDGSNARPGSFAEISFVTGSREVLALPSSAMIHRHGLDGVYMVDGQGVAHWRLVRSGVVLENGYIEIAAGATSGTQVVTHPTTKLHSGSRVSH
ncbi:MAG: efflux RND transporter periplasmic adaptor subunit [Mariprofundales bacterium]